MKTEPGHLNLCVSEAVLERLIASGALCASEVGCQRPVDQRSVAAICKRCCMHSLGGSRNRRKIA